MRAALIFAQVLSAFSICWAQSPSRRLELKLSTTSHPTRTTTRYRSRSCVRLSNASQLATMRGLT